MSSNIVVQQHYFKELVQSPYFEIISPDIIGEMLFNFRKSLNVTKSQLTANSGLISMRDISLIECGKESRPFMWKKYITLLINYSNQLKF